MKEKAEKEKEHWILKLETEFNRHARQQIIKFQEEVDLENHHLFPRDNHGNLLKNKAPWQLGNCAETNTWFHQASQIPELPIRTCAIKIKTQEIYLCCENCQMIIECSTCRICGTPMILPHLLGYLKDKKPYHNKTNEDKGKKSIDMKIA